MYNILAISPGHNGSVAVVSDGEVALYIEEERLSRLKYDGNPFRGMLEAMARFHIDELVLGGGVVRQPRLIWTGEDPFTALVRKFDSDVRVVEGRIETVKVVNHGGAHHLGHAAGAFYNSGFKTAVAVIVDGAGSKHTYSHVTTSDGSPLEGYETETIFACAYPAQFPTVYRSYGNNSGPLYQDERLHFDSAVTITKAYEAVSRYLGFSFVEAGKTMGLAPYGEADPNLPELFINGRGNKNLFIPNFELGPDVDYRRFPYLALPEQPMAWHRDPSRVTQVAKNLAWKVQQDTQQLVGDLIQKAVETTGEKNVVIAGGYGLNCVANYYYLQRFPDLNIYVDPVAHDGGTAIGLALYQWYKREEELHPKRNWANYARERIRHIYLGPERPNAYSDIESLADYDAVEATAEDVAQRLAEGNIVALFNGRSEAGPRALGNRSILFDPRVPNGKEIVNKVKGREWFRPFAGSVLREQASAWFDLQSLDESPFMMYAVNVHADKQAAIPAITHVDGTCRIQTVTREQNLHYYDLIEAFYRRTGCPMVFNTSFNLAGEPLVETLTDAIKTLRKSAMNYLYLPAIGKMLVKRPSVSATRHSERPDKA